MDLTSRVLDLAVEIQQIPAPTFEETARAALVLERFSEAGLQDVHLDPAGNVLGRLPGRDPGRKPLVVSAHLDTVFPAGTDLTITRQPDRISGPGIGDNSLGVAGLFALAWERPGTFPGDLWLAANVCEEGLGDLRGMKVLVDHFGADPLAYLVLEGMGLGQVYHRALGVRRYRITVRARGGHSWKDYGQPSAVHEIARLITWLADLPLPHQPRTTLNIGKVQGGTSVNVLAAEAHLELDLRSEGAAALADLIEKAETLAGRLRRDGVSVEMEGIGERPAGDLPAGHPLVRLASDSLRAQGIEPELTIGSTDANIPLSRGYPAVCLSLTRGDGAHTTGEFLETAPLALGLAQLRAFVDGVWLLDL